MARIITLVALCFTLADVNNQICRALCRQDGFDTGFYREGKCLCAQEFAFEVMTEKRTKINVKAAQKPKEYRQAPQEQTQSW